MGPRILMSIMVSGSQIAVENRDCGRAQCLREGLHGEHGFADAARLSISVSVISAETLTITS
jgi:hypothetical protein